MTRSAMDLCAQKSLDFKKTTSWEALSNRGNIPWFSTCYSPGHRASHIRRPPGTTSPQSCRKAAYEAPRVRDTERQIRRTEFRASETRQSQGQACTLKELRDSGSTWRIYFFRWLPDKTTGLWGWLPTQQYHTWGYRNLFWHGTCKWLVLIKTA